MNVVLNWFITSSIGSSLSMTTLDFETDEMAPVATACKQDRVWITLKDGRGISAPPTWYPILADLSDAELNEIELQLDGIWWTVPDEGGSSKSMFLGWKAPGSMDPEDKAA